MDRLKSCVEIANLLADYNKVVEDDTCLERILTAIQEILSHDSPSDHWALVSSEALKAIVVTFKGLWDRVLQHKEAYCSSTINFLLKFNSVILLHGNENSEKREEAISFIVKFPDIFCPGESRISSSIANSWIASLRLLMTNCKTFKNVLKHVKIESVANLSELSSIFVHKQACDFLTELGICLQKTADQKFVQNITVCKDFYKVIKCKLSIKTALEVATKMLNTDYNAAIITLSSIPLCSLFKSHKLELAQFVKNGEVSLCHFFEALFVEGIESHMPIVFENVLPKELALEYATTALVTNPTKPTGWKMLGSFLMHNQSQQTECAVSMIMWPVQSEDSRRSVENNDKFQEWIEFLRLLQSNRTKMTMVTCHCLNAISKMWKSSGIEKFLNDNVLPSLIRDMDLFCNTNAAADVKKAVFAENWRVAQVMLKVFIENFDVFPRLQICPLKCCLLKLMERQIANHSVTQLSYKLCLTIFIGNKDLVFIENCLKFVTQNLLDRRWEVRDSSLEFLSQLLTVFPEVESSSTKIDKLLKSYSIHTEAIRMLQDSDSFVRASALVLVKNIIKHTGVVDDDVRMTIYQSTVAILMTDFEAAPRRSAVFTLLECTKNKLTDSIFGHLRDTRVEESNSVGDEINSGVLHAINHALFEDLDWEVKYNAIDFLEHLICLNRNDFKSDALEKHLKVMLVKMLDDYDTAVKEKALSIHSSLFDQGSGTSERVPGTLIELDNLLEEVLLSLRKDEQLRLTHGCHGPSIISNGDMECDSVVMDCY